MINDDVLIKYARSRLAQGHTMDLEPDNWVDYVRFLSKQLLACKLGFPGIGDDDISIIRLDQVRPGIRLILDDNLDANCGRTDTDRAPILGQVKDFSETKGHVWFEIEGIGSGTDFERDPDRLLRWGQVHEVNLLEYPCLLSMDSKPRPDGGPVYYYYNKHPRDSRW
jgi:hypothetical protein